ncbi:hypothetical protein M405DRAFT_328060 [Rhizopogon salebrosus TDB-379]|nr:hypothetical protein M405DRAFT_328060 [Rhizopogon salebrosus TDB-379]
MLVVCDDTRWAEFGATGSHNAFAVDDGSEFVVLHSTRKNGANLCTMLFQAGIKTANAFIQGVLLLFMTRWQACHDSGSIHCCSSCRRPLLNSSSCSLETRLFGIRLEVFFDCGFLCSTWIRIRITKIERMSSKIARFASDSTMNETKKLVVRSCANTW